MYLIDFFKKYIIYIIILLILIFTIILYIKYSQYKNIIINNIDDLLRISPNENLIYDVQGFYTKGDGGGGKFYYDKNSNKSHNGGTIITANKNCPLPSII